MINYTSHKYNLSLNYLELEKIFLFYLSYCEKNDIVPFLTLEEFYQVPADDFYTFNEKNINTFFYFSQLEGFKF
jgi:hypothetical protein